MEKILLVDGNSMLFRAYYGTQGRGLMKSSSGVVTNAVYGFSTMLAKALEMIHPDYILVAFDTGEKTFRHEMYSEYKGTRSEVDPELISQFALVREFLDAHGICRYELNGYEADDVIGTLAQKYAASMNVEILTSDRDMLQLIADNVDVLLMKKGLTEIQVMDVKTLKETMGITPQQIIDLKALMGDSSDNIPGVPSVGEKTGLKLLDQYQTLAGVYEHKDEVKGKLGEKLREFEDQARLSYDLATIHCNVPVDLDLEQMRYVLPTDRLNAFYRKYDMNSLLVETEAAEDTMTKTITLVPLSREWLNEDVVVSGHFSKEDELLGLALYNGKETAYLTQAEMIGNNLLAEILNQKVVLASTSKPLVAFALKQGWQMKSVDDVMLLAFIVDSSITTLSRLKDEYSLWFRDYEGIDNLCRFTQELKSLFERLTQKAQADDVFKVYEDIEKPLAPVLAQCEVEGVCVDKEILQRIADQTLEKLKSLSDAIYDAAGKEFNINSPKQLGDILFDDLQLPSKKKRSTAVDVLESLVDVHPIIQYLLEYRKYQKLYSTYATGLLKHIGADGRIHTTFNQHAAQTGRLSSSNPNLQNISIRDEEARQIRKAFIASENRVLMSMDYSQIELRVLSYLADEKRMMQAFNDGEDIHEETAKEVFGVETITPNMRRQAKTVNFGIVYGISDFGLAKQLDIPVHEAADFIHRYYAIYPNIKIYMESLVAQCEAQGFVTTFFGRRRYIPEIKNSNRAVREFGKRAAMNAPIQGSAADIIKLAMIAADQAIRHNNLKTRMILQVHDELLFDVFEPEVKQVEIMMQDIMENIVPTWPVRLKVSTTIGKDWFED